MPITRELPEGKRRQLQRWSALQLGGAVAASGRGGAMGRTPTRRRGRTWRALRGSRDGGSPPPLPGMWPARVPVMQGGARLDRAGPPRGVPAAGARPPAPRARRYRRAAWGGLDGDTRSAVLPVRPARTGRGRRPPTRREGEGASGRGAPTRTRPRRRRRTGAGGARLTLPGMVSHAALTRHPQARRALRAGCREACPAACGDSDELFARPPAGRDPPRPGRWNP